jgi:hypothetical protein
MEWTCTVEAVNDTYVGDVEDLSERVLARLGSHHGSVAFGDRRIVARFIVDARLALQATETARKAWNKALDDELAWSIVSLSVRPADQPDDLPALPKLLGIAEVAKRLDVSKQRRRTGPQPPTVPTTTSGVSLWPGVDRMADRFIPTILDP